MAVRPFNQAFVDDARKKLEQLTPETKPQWGSMSSPQMLAHMVTALRYSLGKEHETPNEGGFFGAYIASPLILSGLMKIPKGQKGPAMYDTAAPSATVNDLVVMLEEFLGRLQDSAFSPPPHPYFGSIGAKGWASLHIVHLEHHLRQFGLDTTTFVKG